ncbi:LuxR family transcriptional regulator [Nonomuraea longispora]|uniref:LuxR family transcriptional regulator n=1 Tax=Nonomuraea longispora TaxID=1848320 RepID=A0A4R4N0J5_9ACTN|nr:LuxR C-terminal-related transcriptional regulator [Nonomuraea longispora]TDC01294.1 LuxR family transcriptional regulator [Nonomuraea longispora]
MAESNIVNDCRLPSELNSFVGRRHEVADVKRLLSESRLVTLVGVGGVGKSRLALRVALDVRRAFPDGVWLVELAALEDPELLVQTVSEALGIQDRSVRSPIDVLTSRLRDEHLLVVLDNCEHLLDDCAVLAATLIRAVPRLSILATSRQALGVTGELTMPVPPLVIPGLDSECPSIASLRQSDAVRLFVDRAHAVLPGFELTKDNGESVARICRRLDGIPLAIELAAVSLRAISVDQLLARLDDRFRLLTKGARTAMPRQRTLRALIDWSYGLCTEQEQLLWARLSVFSGGVDLEAAEQVCSGDGIEPDEMLDLVSGLVGKSVLAREEHGTSVRYRLLETIRQYGRDRLRESGGEHEMRTRHRDWCRDLVDHAQRAWYGPEQLAWFARLRAEHDNIRAALDFCLTTPGEGEPGLDIATALRFYWIASGSFREGRSWLDRLLAEDREPSAARARALVVDARLAVLQSDFTVAAAMLDECHALVERLGEESILARSAYVVGFSALLQRDLDGALSRLGEAVERSRDEDDQTGVVNALIYLATAYSLLGHAEQAVTHFKECMEMCEAREEHWFRSYTLWVYGVEKWRQGDTAEAVEMERLAIRLKQPFDDRLGIALCIEALAWMAAGDEPERAAVLLGAARENWRSFGGPLFGNLSDYHDACEASTRERLGGRRFESAFRKGTELGSAAAVAYAMGEDPSPCKQATEPSPLTRREAQIARLVAEGMSNKAIAASLVIAQRTAEGHVEHILNKLGFTSRAQIAAWVGEQDHRNSGSSS